MRKYKCPICGKEWDNLKDMYECALNDETNEENERKIKEQEQREMEAKIQKDFTALKNLISKYNLNYAPYNFEVTLTHYKKKEEVRGTKDWKNAVPPLNYKSNNPKSDTDLEGFLKDKIGIGEPKKKNPSKEQMRKEIEDMVTDEDVKAVSSLYGDMSKDELVDSLADLAGFLSDMGLPWE